MPQAPRRRSSPKPSPSPGPAAEGGSSTPSQPSPAPASNPLGFAGVTFTPPGDGQAPNIRSAAELEAELAYAPPPPAPIEWDGDKATPVLTALGFVLHSLDPVAGSAHAPELWKMTEDDLEAIGAPLARIANRYELARQLAGKSDEISVAVAVFPYVKSNLAARGRAKALDAQDEHDQERLHASRYTPTITAPTSAPAAESEAAVEPPQDPSVPEGDVFDSVLAPGSLLHLPPNETSRG